MYKLLPAIILCFLLTSCRQKENFDKSRYKIDNSKYNMIFEGPDGIEVNFKTKILKVNFVDLKFTDTLKFTQADNQTIWRLFNESGLSNSKGNIWYNPLASVNPALYKIIQIFKDNKPISIIHINWQCRLDNLPMSDMYRAIRFQNAIIDLLNKHPAFANARKRYDKYRNDHFMFDL